MRRKILSKLIFASCVWYIYIWNSSLQSVCDIYRYRYTCIYFNTFTFQLLDKPWSQGLSLLPPGSCLQFLSRIGFSSPTARRFFHRMLLTHPLALSASQFVHKKKSQRIYNSMPSAGLELTKLTYTRFEDNLIRHRGDRSLYPTWVGLRVYSQKKK